MSGLPKLNLLDTVHGDIVLDQQQAADIGNAMGNGAATFTSPAAAGVIPMGESGNLSVITAQPGINPASTAADIVLAAYKLPAGALDVANRILEITANGSTAANTNTKTIKMIAGATNPVVGQAVVGGTIIASATINTVPGGGGWSLAAQITKFGAKGSNTQQALHSAAQTGNVVGALQAPSALALNEAQPITIVVTGNAATTATDISFNSLQVVGMN
jgi:hypothetical protein